MITGTTSTGFTFELEDETFDDYELLETLQEIDNGNEALVVRMVDILLGREQKERLKAHIRGANGKVSVTGMMREVTEIFSLCKEGKN